VEYTPEAEPANVDREAFAIEIRDEIPGGGRLGYLAVQPSLEHGRELARERELRAAGHRLGVRA
jgi:hypothetical protein